MRRVMTAFFLVVAIVACGSSPAHRSARAAGHAHAAAKKKPAPPPAPAASASASPTAPPAAPAVPPPPRHARLHYQLPGIAPLPFVHGKLGDAETWMLVDSGAGTHVGTGWLARKAGVRLVSGGDGIEDHARVTLSASRTDLSALSLESWGRLPSGKLLVIEEDEKSLSARAGVGVYLSPQNLDADRAIVVDFEHAEMKTADAREVDKALDLHAIDPLSDGVRTCRGIFLVNATIEGQPTTLAIDTGASTSTLYAATRAGRVMAPRATTSKVRAESASGAIQTKTFKDAHVKVGDWSQTASIEILPGAPAVDCPTDGVLGFDRLRACVLVFGPGPATLRARCPR